MLTKKQSQAFVDWYKLYYGDLKDLPEIHPSEQQSEEDTRLKVLKDILWKDAKKIYKIRKRWKETVLDKVFSSLWLNYWPRVVASRWTFTHYTYDYLLKWWWWSKLIIDTFDKIQEHIDKGNYPYELNISYIKEKYGWLRVEANGMDNYVFDIINKLEIKSETICDVCWKKGKTRFDLWRYRTLCRRHYLPIKIKILWGRLKISLKNLVGLN